MFYLPALASLYFICNHCFSLPKACCFCSAWLCWSIETARQFPLYPETDVFTSQSTFH